MSRTKLVVVTGNNSVQSRTKVIAEAIAAEITKGLAAEVSRLEIATLAADIGPYPFRSQFTPRGEAALKQIESADLLIAASPVYKASYTGLFKHLFDWVDPASLIGKPIALAATGGSERHALIIEHQLRPLFGCSQALTLPTGVYAVEADFDGYVLRNESVIARIHMVAAEALSALRKSGAQQGLTATA